jgi:hypothetical protein
MNGLGLPEAIAPQLSKRLVCSLPGAIASQFSKSLVWGISREIASQPSKRKDLVSLIQ